MQAQTFPMEQRLVPVNGTHLNITTAGPSGGVPVILLHGFPEFWFSYRFQIPALAEAGFRVIAPDQRGYNLSGKQGPFDLQTLCRDIVGLQEALDLKTSHLVGHDWGGVVAWTFAALHPQQVQKLVILNAPHLKAYRDACKRHPVQLLRSWYILFFQAPWLPEWSIKARNYRVLELTFSTVNPQSMQPADIAEYKKACAQPGALSAMIGWYRAALRNRSTYQLLNGSSLNVPQPALVIWGENDPYLDQRCNETLPRYVANLKIHPVKASNHWVQMDQPEIVNALMLEHLSI